MLNFFGFLSLHARGLPFSGQTDARMFWAAFAQGEQFPDDLLGFTQNQGRAGPQLGVALLQRQVSHPGLGNHGHIQKPVSGQALQEGFEFICRRGQASEKGKGAERETRHN